MVLFMDVIFLISNEFICSTSTYIVV